MGDPENELYERAREGSFAALIALQDKALTKLVAHLRRRFEELERSQAEDIAHEALSRGLRRALELPTWRRALGYLKKTAKHLALRKLKKLRKTVSLSQLVEKGEEPPDPRSADAARARELEEFLDGIAKRLEPQHRLILRSLRSGDPPTGALRELLGSSERTIRRHKQGIRDLVRRELADPGES
jgi:DNA-directed RNA polymerase specialized sigma24 family protein